jgi:hypothetical protein
MLRPRRVRGARARGPASWPGPPRPIGSSGRSVSSAGARRAAAGAASARNLSIVRDADRRLPVPAARPATVRYCRRRGALGQGRRDRAVADQAGADGSDPLRPPRRNRRPSWPPAAAPCGSLPALGLPCCSPPTRRRPRRAARGVGSASGASGGRAGASRSRKAPPAAPVSPFTAARARSPATRTSNPASRSPGARALTGRRGGGQVLRPPPDWLVQRPPLLRAGGARAGRVAAAAAAGPRSGGPCAPESSPGTVPTPGPPASAPSTTPRSAGSRTAPTPPLRGEVDGMAVAAIRLAAAADRRGAVPAPPPAEMGPGRPGRRCACRGRGAAGLVGVGDDHRVGKDVNVVAGDEAGSTGHRTGPTPTAAASRAPA